MGRQVSMSWKVLTDMVVDGDEARKQKLADAVDINKY